MPVVYRLHPLHVLMWLNCTCLTSMQVRVVKLWSAYSYSSAWVECFNVSHTIDAIMAEERKGYVLYRALVANSNGLHVRQLCSLGRLKWRLISPELLMFILRRRRLRLVEVFWLEYDEHWTSTFFDLTRIQRYAHCTVCALWEYAVFSDPVTNKMGFLMSGLIHIWS